MHSSLNIFLLLSQIAIILGLSRLVGLLFARLHQPQVMGEMIAGIMLGPSLLGAFAPSVQHTLFPAGSIVYLSALSQVGVIFFLFLIGLELDPKLLRNRGHAALVVSHVSIVAPFLLGAGLTLYLYPRLFNHTGPMRFTAVALFMGAAMSITAFPVLARILTERNLHRTKVGAMTITCAAVDDVTAWCMLAFVVAVARAQGIHAAVMTASLSVAYVLIMFFAVRPFLRRLEAVYERQGRLSQTVVAIILLLVLASACATEWIGIHALFGAFVMGCIMPKGTRFVRHLSEKLEDYTVVLLLPIFFAFSGLNTEIGLLNNSSLWMDTLLIILAACLGKFGGSAVAARACGIGWREASAVGILMNTRGLMELVILNAGRELGVISPAVFAMMVIMAIVTTAMTTPILAIVYPARLLRRESAGEKTKQGYSVLIPVALPKSGGPLVQIADMLIGPNSVGSKLIALHLRRPVDHEAYRSGLDDVEPPQDPALTPLLSQARAHGMPVEAISLISRDIPTDIANTARENAIDLVLMGFHKPVIGRTILGGTVHRVLTHAEADVAIFVDRGFREAIRVLVPYLGSKHDRLALELAGRIARNADATVTILHVVPPMRGDASRSLDARTAVDRAFQEPGVKTPFQFKVIEDSSPVGVVLHQARESDLVIIGVAEEWGLESHLFGWRAERIARDCPSSLLIVRKYGAVGAAVAPVISAEPIEPATLS